MNAIQLTSGFMDGSKQSEKFNEETIDRNDIEPLYFSENSMEIAVLTSRPIPAAVGKIVAYQYAPCQSADGACEEFKDHLAAEVPIQKCSSKKQKDIEEYWTKRFGEIEGAKYASNAVCLDLEGIYIAGEPATNSEASLIIAFNRHPDIVTDRDQPDYDSELDQFYEKSLPYVHVDFSQVDMKKGTLERVTKSFKIRAHAGGISLSKNELIDRNDSFGLIHTEPEPKTFFSVEQYIRDYYDQNWAVYFHEDIL